MDNHLKKPMKDLLSRFVQKEDGLHAQDVERAS